MSNSLRSIGRLLARILALTAWTLETVVLGVGAVWRAGLLLAHWRAILGPTLRCARGHASPAFGVFECARCHAPIEGWVFRSCSVCHTSAAWTPCAECGLAIRNPLLT